MIMSDKSYCLVCLSITDVFCISFLIRVTLVILDLLVLVVLAENISVVFFRNVLESVRAIFVGRVPLRI